MDDTEVAAALADAAALEAQQHRDIRAAGNRLRWRTVAFHAYLDQRDAARSEQHARERARVHGWRLL